MSSERTETESRKHKTFYAKEDFLNLRNLSTETFRNAGHELLQVRMYVSMRYKSETHGQKVTQESRELTRVNERTFDFYPDDPDTIDHLLEWCEQVWPDHNVINGKDRGFKYFCTSFTTRNLENSKVCRWFKKEIQKSPKMNRLCLDSVDGHSFMDLTYSELREAVDANSYPEVLWENVCEFKTAIPALI